MKKVALLLLSVSMLSGAEPPKKDFGSIDSGYTIPHLAVGGGVWTTEFRVFSLEDFIQAFTVRFFDSNGDPLVLDIDVPGGPSLDPGDTVLGGVKAGGIVRFRAGPAGPLKVGYAILETSEFSGLAIDAVITNGAAFQTSVPGMRRFQGPLRFPFVNSGGFVSCVAWKSDTRQDVTMIVRDGDGVELCRAESELADDQHEAFCLQDRLPCVADQDGLMEVGFSSVGVSAISLTADPLGRLWTTVPYDLCCFDVE